MHPKSVAVYRADLRNMIAIEKDRGIVPVLVFQPSLHHKMTPTSHELASRSHPDACHYYGVDMDSMRTLVEFEAQTMHGVPEAEHVRWADFRTVLDGVHETTYNDLVHTSDDGNRIVAEHLATLLAPVLPHGQNAQ